MHAIMGKNGSGKSTLSKVRRLAGRGRGVAHVGQRHVAEVPAVLAAATISFEHCVLLVTRSVHASVETHEETLLAGCWPAVQAAMPFPQRLAIDCHESSRAAHHLAVAVCRRCWWATLNTR